MSAFNFKVQAGQDINTNVGFNPLSVVVSNYSPYYIWFPDGLSFCPPWTGGVIIPLQHATQARALWSLTPFGTQLIAPPDPAVVYSATFVFTDQNEGLSAGTSIINPFSTSGAGVLDRVVNSFQFAPSALTGSTYEMISPPVGATNKYIIWAVSVERNIGQFGDSSEGSSPINWLIQSTTSQQLIAFGRLGQYSTTSQQRFETLGRSVAEREGVTIVGRSSFSRDIVTVTFEWSGV
jgi:hypothetical protein